MLQPLTLAIEGCFKVQTKIRKKNIGTFAPDCIVLLLHNSYCKHMGIEPRCFFETTECSMPENFADVCGLSKVQAWHLRQTWYARVHLSDEGRIGDM